ncbi:helix-turn-helix domain-containing protein [Rhodoferax sp.]|uniref:helix-turn-helix domain-containing protein n=1 Tax=Rhodoferax sp. TaxID=50421 RepID=UPI0025F0D16F|nr:helix-turn-helix domain-containing protein [Rhodoferax sp.]MCM2340449.1 helix-turn-helix domain-containing protein [Rhodoferax sp.]
MSSLSDRIREVREGLGFSQQQLADKGGVTARSQRNYEAGERFPDAAYLMAIAAAGADVRYILTGSRDGPVPVALTDDERAMLADYREASGPVRRAARAALQSGASPPAAKHSQVNTAPDAIQVRGSGNTVLSHRKK